MSPDTVRIGLADIDPADLTYRISTHRDDRLDHSIRHIGQIHPIQVLARDGALVILSGFRRVAACRAVGLAHVSALVHPDGSLDPRQRCVIAIADNATQRPLNPLETARSVALLHRQLSDPEDIRDCLSALSLPRNPAWLQQQLALSRLTDALQQHLLTGVMGTAMALELGALDPADGTALAGLFASLRLSLSRQREVLGLCRDLARRDGVAIRQVLAASGLQALLADPEADNGIKTRKLRNYLKHRRYPSLTAAEARFDQGLKSLALGPDVRLDPPPFFEGTTYRLSLSFSTVEELRRQLDAIRGKTATPQFHRLMARTRD